MPLYINGEVANISLAQLVAEGKEIIEDNIPHSGSTRTLVMWIGL